MTTLELYTKGARVWVPHKDRVWQEGRVVENFTRDMLKIAIDDGQVLELKITSDEELPPLRNPDILIGENDLTSLSYLHEPAVLYNLEIRFCRHNAIYTYCGIVLVAINPYTEMPIYGPDTLWTYRGQNMGDLEPHIFAVAEEAYTKMEREQTDQSIIVSGESGAGKTVSAKYAMRYFATVGGSATETQVEKKVLASSPIMEAIGNAKTTRNDNSSRFGKFIELAFSQHYNIVGASMRTYLLEKSRVVFQAPNERNYHVFYQLCASRKRHPDLNLSDASDFMYLSEESDIPGVDDSMGYDETVNAMSVLGFSKEDITGVMTVLACVLHLGNVQIVGTGGGDSDGSTIEKNDSHLKIFTQLAQLDIQELTHWLCHRQIVSMKEVVNKPMGVSEAKFARDALAKHIYAVLFNWIVDVINKALKSSAESKHKFIGVLDIYGFETFVINSFEQFCINYANEKLQQQFNMHVFKLEQEEYLKEGIEWKFIDFYDNQPCIDLIESKLGILDLLDEECRMPNGSDNSWAQKLCDKCTKWAHFAKPRFGTSSFVIRHFADKVDYEVAGFLEKNRDTIIEEQIKLLRSSGHKMFQRLFSETPESPDKLSVPKGAKLRISAASKAPPTGSALKNKKTVGSQFRDSLNALMTTLNATTPHYIRCIKPNDDKAAFVFNPSRAVQQLRACGVLETVRISAAGFPSRWLYNEFLKRYRALCKTKNIDRNDLQSTCKLMLTTIIKDDDKYKFGKTKIFFRAGQVAYLERLRSERLLECCIRIQKTVRGFLVRRRYVRTLRATNTLQRYFRGYLARRRAEGIRRNKAAVKIQKVARGWIARVKYQRLRNSVTKFQAYCRGYLARHKFEIMRKTHAAIVIQTRVRGWLCRRKYLATLRKIVIVQSVVRRHQARILYKKLKIEARSAEHLKKLNKGLENKIISLQQKIGEIAKENQALKNCFQELNDKKAKLEEMRGVDVQLKKVTKLLNEKENHLQELIEEKNTLNKKLDELTKFEKDRAREREIMIGQMNVLQDQNAELITELKSARSTLEDEIKKRVGEEKKHLQEEYSLERAAYQKLLAEKDILETKIDSLERQLQYGSTHRRVPSDASNLSTQDDDVGYMSVRSTSSTNREDTPTPEQIDVGLVLKLQQKLRSLEFENQRLMAKAEARKSSLMNSHRQQDSLMVQELEIETSKLKAELQALRECITRDSLKSGDSTLHEITRQLENRDSEVSRLREENVQLRSTFVAKTQSAKDLVQSSYSSIGDVDMTLINEDGELVYAYEALKKIVRQQEDEIQSKTSFWEVEREELEKELKRLRTEHEKQSQLLSANIGQSPQTQSERFLQYEIARLTAENLELQQKFDLEASKSRKLQSQVLELQKKLKEFGVDVSGKGDTSIERPENLPVVKKKDRQYMGMFEFKADDIALIVRSLNELKPCVAITLLPCLPSYILFMCIRYTDHVSNENMLKDVINSYHKTVAKLVKKKASDLDLGVLWLANTLRLANNLKQYSGEPHYAKENTPTQNEHCLKNFDLAEFAQLLSSLAVTIFHAVEKQMEKQVQALAVPAILEHEALPGLTSNAGRGRSASVSSSTPTVKQAVDQLITKLTGYHRMLNLHGIEHEVTVQLFKQLFYFLCASSLNNLLLRKEYCHWSKGMQIRYNLSHLEQWLREQKLNGKIGDMLAPIVQASQLLQARKTDEDINGIVEMCSDLTPNQIIKLLNLYTPADVHEAMVPQSFIDKIQARLKELRKSTETALLMNTNQIFPVDFPFSPSPIRLEDIEVPHILNLPMLKKI